MRLLRLSFDDFRSLRHVEMEPSPQLNVIVGPNGEGKTNLLEAIWVLSGGRSPRSSEITDLIRHGQETAQVVGDIELDATGGRREVRLRLRRGEPRRYLVNGKASGGPARLFGSLSVLWFSPDQVDVVRAGPAMRRHFMDTVLAQADEVYRATLVRYHRALAQRNQALRRWQAIGTTDDFAELRAWDGQLAESGALVMAAREALVRAVSTFAVPIHNEIAGDGELLEVSYRPSLFRTGIPGGRAALLGTPAEGGPGPWRDALAAALSASQAIDLRRGSTLAGPHRDDLAISVGANDLRRFGSRGQQRAAAVALYLGAWRWMRERTGEAPLLLLDDIASELDAARRRRLLAVLPSQAQVFVTGTDFDPAWQAPLASSGGRTWRVSGKGLELIPGAGNA